jgi:predicted transcriptional regulator
MQVPTPEELKQKREALHLTQVEVAQMAGISQSMIARIERGTVDPRVSTLGKVVRVLVEAERSTITASDVMCTPVYSVLTTDPISRAVSIMEERGISQLPVLENGVPMGCISEGAILNAIEEGRSPRGQMAFIRDFMESGFPTIPLDADLNTIVHILQNNHAVLVVDRGMIRGVITKHDLIPLIT